MTGRRAIPHLSSLAAFLAVCLLLLAGVRSNVMQAEMAAASSGAMPTCMGMSGKGSSPSKPEKSDRACGFCAVAGHLPVCGSPPPLAVPIRISWIAWRPLAGLGSRGPPALPPRARGPPETSLIA